MKPNSNSKKTEKSQPESVGKENGATSYPPPPSFENLKEGEDRTSYLTRKGFAAILEYDKKEDKLNLTSQEKTVISAQLRGLEQEINYHMNIVMNYLTDEGTSVETGTNVKQVEASLQWLEEIDPLIGKVLRRELFLKQKDKYNHDMFQAEKAESNMEEKSENQVSQQQYTTVPEQPPLIGAGRGLGAPQYLLGGFLVLYIVGKVYQLVNKYKNKNKEI